MRIGIGLSLAQSVTPPDEGGGGEPGYTAETVTFSALAEFARGAPLTGVVDGPVGFINLWVKPGTISGGIDFAIAVGGNFEIRVEGPPAQQLQAYLYDEQAASFAEIRADSALNFGEGNHLLVAWDMGHAVGERLFAVYKNDTQVPVVFDSEDGVAFDIDYTAANFRFFAKGNDSVAETFSDSGMWLGSSIVEADGTISEVNRRKFIDEDGKPTDPSNWPANPVLKFSGDAAAFLTNQGSGGAFTLVSGTVTDSDWNPSA